MLYLRYPKALLKVFASFLIVFLCRKTIKSVSYNLQYVVVNEIREENPKSYVK